MMRPVCSLILLAVAACTGGGGSDAGPALRTAAVAYRDRVPEYQRLGSERFTVPYLKSGYTAYWYVDQLTGPKDRSEFGERVAEATRDYDVVDLFILANGPLGLESWIPPIPPAQRAKIRLVYNTAAGGTSEAREWLELGAQAYVSHPGNNMAPIFYAEFLPRWTRGEKLDDAVDAANKYTKAKLDSTTGSLTAWATEKITGRKVDLGRLWTNTEAQIFRNPAPLLPPGGGGSRPDVGASPPSR